MKTEIIYQDNHILICRKPAGLPTQTARIGQVDMVSELKNYLAQNKGSEPYLGLIHRLDQPVEGLLVFGKNPKATKILSQQLREGALHKSYYAVTINQPYAEVGMLEDFIIKDAGKNMAKIVTADTPGAKKAVLHYRMISAVEGKVLYVVQIDTGRFHQIRAQMAHAGMSLLGDQKYADEETRKYSMKNGIRNVALCACEIVLKHPETGKKMSFAIQPEGEAFQDFYEEDTKENRK